MKTRLFLCYILCLLQFGFSQETKNSTTWPYDGRPISKEIIEGFSKPCLRFNTANFVEAVFNDNANFACSVFDSQAYFVKTRFANSLDFSFSTFNKPVYFNYAHFEGVVRFHSAKFRQLAGFSDGASFNQKTVFSNTEFQDIASFITAEFNNDVEFDSSTFHAEAAFRQTVFKGNVSFFRTTFLSGLDLRNSNFAPGKNICLDGIVVPVGKFWINWEDFSGKLKHVGNDYYLAEKTYEFLQENFLAQNDSLSAARVMREFSQKRPDLVGDFRVLIDAFFGFGTKAVRYLGFIVVPSIIIFAVIWYLFYYPLIVPILDPELAELIFQRSADRQRKYNSANYNSMLTTKKKKLFRILSIQYYDHSKFREDVTRFARIMHVIVFSASVLLGFRFKKEWINTRRNRFLVFVVLEWVWGIILVVYFIYTFDLPKQFEPIKQLFGL